jgi:hypothetical protein
LMNCVWSEEVRSRKHNFSMYLRKVSRNNGKTKQNKTKRNKTKQNKTKRNKTKQNKTKQNKTKQLLHRTRLFCFLRVDRRCPEKRPNLTLHRLVCGN